MAESVAALTPRPKASCTSEKSRAEDEAEREDKDKNREALLEKEKARQVVLKKKGSLKPLCLAKKAPSWAYFSSSAIK